MPPVGIVKKKNGLAENAKSLHSESFFPLRSHLSFVHMYEHIYVCTYMYRFPNPDV
jgi:hypothetical protein